MFCVPHLPFFPSSGPYRRMQKSTLTKWTSFAELEMSLILAKLNFKYDLEMVNKGLDWERESHMHVMWWKPELRVRFIAREKA